MQTISSERIDKLVEDIANLDDEVAVARVHQLSAEQPAIFAYLLATAETSLTAHEQEHLIFLGISVWHIMKESAAAELEAVGIETLEAVEEHNIRMFDFLETEDTESDLLHSVGLIMENYNQPHVFEYVLESLMEIALGSIDFDSLGPDTDLEALVQSRSEEQTESDEETLSDEALGAMLLSLKTVIDCFDKQN